MSNPAFKTISPAIIPPALVALIAFAFGIVLDRYWECPWGVYLLIATIALITWLILISFGRLEKARLASILIACSAAGAYWHHGCWNWFPARDLTTHVELESVPVCLRARIKGEGKFSAKTTQQTFDAMPSQARTTFLIEPLEIRNSQTWEPLGGIAKLVVHTVIADLAFGDEVMIYGKLSGLGPPTSPGQFNFQDFYRAKSIGANVHVYSQDSILIEKSGSQVLTGLLSRIRRRLNQEIWRHVGQEQAAFASAILLGNREQLSHDQRERFVATGTAHLLAISGLHIGILASMFLLMYRVGILDRKAALWSTIIFVVVYAWLVEFRPPVTRAALLLILFCAGRLLGRSGFELNLLAIAGILILIINPGDLFLLGPQLSFLAVASLIMFKQHIFPPLSKDPIDVLIRGSRPGWIRITTTIFRRCKQAVLVSGLIWLIGLPLVAANYHLVTPISLVTNPLVMIPIAVALFCGLGVCAFGIICPPLAGLFGAGAANSLSIVEAIVNKAADVEVGHWWTAGPIAISIVVFYLSVSLLSFVRPERRLRLLMSLFLLWVSIFWMLPFQAAKIVSGNTAVRCTFIDVGHGSATWCQTKDGRNILLDAGSMSSSRFAAQSISNVLWANQIEHIDAIIISHADLDHFNALPELIKRFSIGVVCMSEPMAESRHPIVAELQKQLNEASVKIRRLSRGDRAEIGHSQHLKVLLPPKTGTGGNDNSNSIVLSIQSGERSILIPGDLEGIGMQILLQLPSLDCDLISMPHHGSKNSRPEEFISWATPEYVVISASTTRTDREVVAQISDDVESVVSTGDAGTIQVQLDDDEIRLVHWCGDRWADIPNREAPRH